MTRPIVAGFLLLFTHAASALVLTSNAAGFAGTFSPQCWGTSGNTEIEIFSGGVSCLRQGVIEFDISGTGITGVNSAIATIFDGAAGNSEGANWPIDVYGYAGDGVVTENDFDAGSYVASATWHRYAPDAAAFSIDLTDYFNQQFVNGTPIVGLNLRIPGASVCQGCYADAFIYFDGALGDHPPTLTLQPVPVPAVGWIFGMAIMASGWTRRQTR